MKNFLKTLAFIFLIVPTVWAINISPVNGLVTVTANGATDRTRMSDLAVSSCTLQAPSTNTGTVYVGGPTVTNASGANKGIALVVGASIGSVTVSNLNMLYAAADTANDKVAYLCN